MAGFIHGNRFARAALATIDIGDIAAELDDDEVQSPEFIANLGETVLELIRLELVECKMTGAGIRLMNRLASFEDPYVRVDRAQLSEVK